MKKLRIYLESTVFNRYFEPERDGCSETRLLFAEIAAGKFEAYTSAYVIKELMDTEDELKRNNMLALISQYNITILDESEAVEVLAQAYVTHGVITEPHYYDRAHIACASVNELSAIISFNFSHINRKKTKELTGPVNILHGYRNLYIGLPMEVIENDESL